MLRKKTTERVDLLTFYGGDIEYNSFDIPVVDSAIVSLNDKKFLPVIKTVKDQSKYIAHFYIDDFQFLRFWREPLRYVKHLQQYHAIVGPDFSMYSNMPEPVIRYNLYRNALLTLIWQRNEINVIPNVTWPVGRYNNMYVEPYTEADTICISNIGLDKNEKIIFEKELSELLNKFIFKCVIIYGTPCKAFGSNLIVKNIPQFINARHNE